MSDRNKPIKDARKVIDRFGGIRPMATTIDVPVTTVQGWKKRNVIPAARREAILKAAASNNIDLSGLLDKGIANENTGNKTSVSAKKDNIGDQSFISAVTEARSDENDARHVSAIEAAKKTEENERLTISQEAIMGKIKETERRAVQKSALVSFLLVGLFAVLIVLLLWPTTEKATKNSQRISALEGEITSLKEDPSIFDRLIPDNLEEDFSRLQNQAQTLQKTIQDYAAQADAAATAVIGPDAGTLSDRLERLEVIVNDLSNSDELATLINKVQGLQQSVQGQEQLSRSVEQMNAVISGMQGKMDSLNQELDQARQQDADLGQTLEGVSSTDLKAAAMLIGLAQFRSSLNRSAPFADDLALLQKMVGSEDPALNEAIARLAPRAEQGVLSPEGLSNEFRGLAGDIVVASLEGEDVTVSEKAKARLGDILKVEKDGELITGTDTQATVTRAQKALDEGDIATAVAELQSLQGSEAQAARPWIEQAEITLLAQKVEDLLTTSVAKRIGNSNVPYTTGGSNMSDIINELEKLGGNKVYTDEESGISIMPQ